MKKVFSLLFAATLLLVSCGDDDESSNSIDSSLIVGTWNFSDLDVDFETEFDFGPISSPRSTSNTAFESSNATITFNDDGTYVVNGDITTLNTQQGEDDFTETESFDNLMGEYTIVGNEITFSDAFIDADTDFDIPGLGNEVYTITELTSDNLVIDVEFSASQSTTDASYFIDLDGFYQFTK